MRKPESNQKKMNPLENRSEYYKTIGEKAAIYTFTKNPLSKKKLSSISPPSKIVLLKEESHRKSDFDITPLLSPLSRDISHLRDKFQIPSSNKLSELPSDLKSAKKLHETIEQVSIKKQSLPFVFKEYSSEMLHKNNSSELPSIEKLLFGPPTGRQEIVHLKNWFQTMKEDTQYEENEENKRLLHVLCSKELIKQVSVHCVERGELLHEVIDFFVNKIESHKENLDVALKSTAKIKRAVIEEFKQREGDFKESIKRLQYECLQFQQEIDRKNREIIYISEELEKEREKIEELKVRLGTDDLSNFKGFRMMHKNTNISWKVRDSLFKSNVTIKNRECLRFDVETQTEVITYARRIPRMVQQRKFVDEEIMTVNIAEDNLETDLKILSLTPLPPSEEPEIVQVKPQDPATQPEEDKSKEESARIITVCDQESQTAFSLNIIPYDYIEANVDMNSYSLEQDDEDSQYFDENQDNIMISDSDLNEKRQKRKSSKMHIMGPKSSNTHERIRSSKILENYQEANRLEVIPDKSSGEENGQFENLDELYDQSSSFSDQKQKYEINQGYDIKGKDIKQKNDRRNSKQPQFDASDIDKSKRRKSNVPFVFPDRTQNKANFKKSVSSVKSKISEVEDDSEKSNISNKPNRNSELLIPRAENEFLVKPSSKDQDRAANLKPSNKDQDRAANSKSSNKDQDRAGNLKPSNKDQDRTTNSKSSNKDQERATNSKSSGNFHISKLQKLPTISINELDGNQADNDINLSQTSNFSRVSEFLHKESHSNQSSLLISQALDPDEQNSSFKRSKTNKYLSPFKFIETDAGPEDDDRSSLRTSKSVSIKTGKNDEVEDENENDESGSRSFDELSENLEDVKKEKSPRKYTKKNTLSHLTEFALFQFNRKGIIKEAQKKNPAKRLISSIISKKESWFKKRATMSRKMLNKMISNLYLSYHTKFDKSEFLSEHLYDEIIAKYGISKVANRKFIEFIASLVCCDDSRRAKIFLRFIGGGALLSANNFSEETLIFYISCLNYLINSKIGISTYDETQDKIWFPTARAIECAKEKLINFDKNIANRVIQKLDRNKINDPKKINSSGLIEGEMFLETVAEVYENIRNHVISGVTMVLNAIKYQETSDKIDKYEAVMIFKEFCPWKIEELEQFYIGKDTVALNIFETFCIEKGALNINHVLTGIPDEKLSIGEVWNIVKPGVETLYMAIDEIKAKKSIVWNEPLGFWEENLEKLLRSVSEREPYQTYLAFHIFNREISRLRSQAILAST